VESGVGELSVYARSRILVQPVPTNLTQGQDLLLECQVIQKSLLKILDILKFVLLESIFANILSKKLRDS
jgi:hypothetical protein